MNAIIIDDEKNGAEALKLLLEIHCKNVFVIAIENSAETGIESILNLKPDLVFLDIEMPTGTGFDVIKATQEINFETIFITAYSQYAIRAFKTNAVDYLLKPVDVEELIAAVNRAYDKIKSKNTHSDKDQISAIVKRLSTLAKKIPIATSDGIMLIIPDDIIHLESDSNYTNVFLKSGQKILVCRTLKSLEAQLDEYNFFRVHSTYLVNLNEVERYIKGDGGTLILKNNVSIPVSRNKKQELLNKIGI